MSRSSRLFGPRIWSGTVDAILARVGDALQDPYDDLVERVRAAKSLNVDETGWRFDEIVRPGVNLNPADTSYGEQVLNGSF